MVVVDRFSKMANFITLKETATAKDAAYAFLKEVWKLHGLPEPIISDRDTKWTSEFWDGVCCLLGIKTRMPTSFYPQTDRQMERVNQSLETYLRTLINYDQDDWYSLLPLVEFADNNSVTQATQLTQLYTNYEYQPKTIWTSSEETKNPATKAYAHWIKATHDRAMQALEKTKDNRSKYYDQHHQPQPSYEEGDEVLLNAKNIRTVRPTRKLALKLYEPFRILAKIGKSAYRLELQSRWRIYNVFHTSLLKPYRKNAIKGRSQI
jgi:hypothetical protein